MTQSSVREPFIAVNVRRAGHTQCRQTAVIPLQILCANFRAQFSPKQWVKDSHRDGILQKYHRLRALVTLAAQSDRRHMSILELAERYDVPKRFLEQMMLELKAKGIVRRIAGRVGGFELARAPEHISMGKVVRIFGEMRSPLSCVSASH